MSTALSNVNGLPARLYLEPFIAGAAITPSDATVLTETKALWVGGAGAITITMSDGNNVLLSGIPAGTLLPIAVTKVLSTGTTATLIVALR